MKSVSIVENNPVPMTTDTNLATHSAEAPESLQALIEEKKAYITGLEYFWDDKVLALVTGAMLDTANACLGVVAEKFIGNATYCQTCNGHLAAGECDCQGWNAARDTLRKFISGGNG